MSVSESIGKDLNGCSQCQQRRSCIVANLLTPKALDRFPGFSRHEAIYIRRQRVFSQDAEFSTCYIVKTGSVKAVSVDSKGNEKIVGFYLPGDIFGWEGIHNGQLPCSAVAMERSTVCKIPLDHLEQVALSRPDFLHSMLKLMSRELNTVETLAALLTRYTAEERVVAFLLEMSQRFAERGLSAHSFRLPMNRTDMGNYLGLAVETVSRILGRIQQRGDIILRGKEVRILKPERLHGIFDRPDEPGSDCHEDAGVVFHPVFPEQHKNPPFRMRRSETNRGALKSPRLV